MWEIKKADRKIIRLMRIRRGGKGSAREGVRETVRGLGRCLDME